MKNIIFYSAICLVIAMQIRLECETQDEGNTRELATNILENRVTALESHFIGHTVILARDGKGISVVPCKLNIDKECYRDDTGISLSNMRIQGWDVGVSMLGNGIQSVPKKQKHGELDVKDTNIDGIKNVSYSGLNNWQFRLNVFWTGIKQSFRELLHPSIGD